jgi:photosystem II stability/assembly factor-like uncharacterized protein
VNRIRQITIIVTALLVMNMLATQSLQMTTVEGDWFQVSSPTIAELRSVHVVNANDSWAVGSTGTILHYDGNNWQEVDAPTSVSLTSVTMINSNDGWAVGSFGGIRHYDGNTWEMVSSPATDTLRDVAMVTANDGWAVGHLGTILHYDGTGWQKVSSPTSMLLYGVSIIDTNDAWAVGKSGTVLHYDGSDWEAVSSPITTTLTGISALATNDVWTTGYSGNIWHYDGSAWEAVSSPTSNDLYGISMLDANNGWAVGDDGTILRYSISKSPSINSAILEHGALSTDGEKVGRSSELYVRVADPDGLSDINSVVVDLSPIGGTTQSLTQDWCIYPENGLYCGTVHTYGDVETGDVTLTITATDTAGLTDSYDLEFKVIMLMYDIVNMLQNDRDAILEKEVWIAAMAAEEFNPENVETGLECIHFGELLLEGDPLSYFLQKILGFVLIGDAKAQLLLDTHPAELANFLLVSAKAWTGPELLPLGVPYYLRVRVEDSGLGYDYVEVLESEEDRPSSTHPHYTIPLGYTFYSPRDITSPLLGEGTQACTIAMITERYAQWPQVSYLRLQLDEDAVPLIARAEGNTSMPGLGVLALVCGTKRAQDTLPGISDVLDTTEGDGLITPLRGIDYSIVHGHEYLGDSSLDIGTECPTDLHLYDAEGHHVGAVYDGDGNVIDFDNSIPDVFYVYGEGDTREFMSVSNPVSGYYTVTVRGTDNGTYTRTISIRNKSGFQTYTATIASVPTTNGQISATLVAEIPAAPTGLNIDIQSGSLLLDWDDNSESDLAGYNIYRSTQANGVYQQVNDSLLSTSSFTDSSADESTAYYYYVTAEDIDYNESGHLSPLASEYFIYLPLVIRNH